MTYLSIVYKINISTHVGVQSSVQHQSSCEWDIGQGGRALAGSVGFNHLSPVEQLDLIDIRFQIASRFLIAIRFQIPGRVDSVMSGTSGGARTIQLGGGAKGVKKKRPKKWVFFSGFFQIQIGSQRVSLVL